ncbi:MAG TPA: hypothetical protein VNC41_00795 [Acidimicrobiia bacterium]|nr:hypothetical protein [Acidimicrobiia bacterium]
MDTEPIRNWLHAKNEVGRMETELAEAKREVEELHRKALDVFEREGVASIRLDGRTISLRRELHASVRTNDRPLVIAALDNLGLSDLAPRGVNARTLSAYVRERAREGEGLPSELAEVVQVAELFKLSSVKSTKG